MKYPKKVSIDFDWKPSKSSKITLVEQIVSYVKMKISSGDWLIGQKLPSQRTLAEKLNVNRSTIVDAYSELLSLGIIESNYGNGTIIKNNTWSLLFLNASTKWSEYISSGIHKENLQTVQTINKLEYDESIIRLSTGEMAQDLFPHEMMKIILNRIPNKVFSYNYVEPLGLLPLRESICSHLKKIGIKANPSQVLIVSGSLQALQLIAISILKPGSTVFVEKPSYIKSLGIFESNGINMKGIPLDQSGLIPWMINSGNTSNTNSILYTIPTFHNPTGITMSADRRFELIDFCKKNQLPIIEDDAYYELWFDEKPPFPLKSIDTSGNVIYIGTASKSLAPGLRIGWVVGPEAVIERLGDIKMQTDYGTSSLSQWVMAEWIDSGFYEEHLIKFRKALVTRRNFVLDLLEKHFTKYATWNIPSGGYYVWLKLNIDVSSDKLFKEAIAQNILINPGNIYSFEQNSYVRLSYSYASLDQLEIGLRKLSEIIGKYAI